MWSVVASQRPAARFLVAASLAATLLLAGVEPAAAAPVPATPASAPFDVAGVLQAASLDATCRADPHCGGTLTVDDRVVIVPRETVVFLPTSALTWQELFARCPARRTHRDRPASHWRTARHRRSPMRCMSSATGWATPHRRAHRHLAGRPGARVRLYRRHRLLDGRAPNRRNEGRRRTRHPGAAQRSERAVRQGRGRPTPGSRWMPARRPSPRPRASRCASPARIRP